MTGPGAGGQHRMVLEAWAGESQLKDHRGSISGMLAEQEKQAIPAQSKERPSSPG